MPENNTWINSSKFSLFLCLVTLNEMTSLHERREFISLKTFAAIKEDKSHKLNELLPKNTTGRYSLRNNRPIFNKCKTERCKSSFIISQIFSQ